MNPPSPAPRASPTGAAWILWAALAAVLVAGLLLFVAHERGERQRLTPPANVIDLTSFLAHMPAPQRAYELIVDGERYIEFNGPLRRFPSLPSGPPAYVFDRTGKLVAWTIDEGDDPAFAARWHKAGRRLLSADEMKAACSR